MKPLKLVVMVPAHNEEATIVQVIRSVPKRIPGVARVEVLVVDDGSTDRTGALARAAGAQVVRHKSRLGLGVAFRDGLREALRLGAGIIVNTDGDNQYNQAQIPDLVAPILRGEADMVLGSRFRGWIEHMPLRKRLGNRLATWAVRLVSGIPVSDAQTGFRAFSREAALHLHVESSYTYTQETILQAAANHLVIQEVPADFRKREDASRLIASIWTYAVRSGMVLLKGSLNYKPLKVFLFIGLLFFLAGFLLGLRVLLHFLATGLVTPYLPSAILTAILIIFGFQVIVIGMIAEMVKEQRRLSEENLYILQSGR
ncbi:MAG: glycosyltransferase family 2 protein [Candidatus Aenigmarchaeota archaeon]|nr:glycosyltransferase family 2 protein [Candidatus Aenigmarchaeota archaeon]